ncbi:hypothetical protein [Blastopirellula marina]|uniref:Uncharacterized protein n=1 Tax=Blastopirellula marina DSM 3645 TaxID=314230 RepID=A3ZMW8_9BACT|nr:hypothetical protein [Blastopirellula marina]EAQ82297.1 hypothetical protein DSM3645_01245 [Blastopirellula marina DSM 3645]
MSIGESPNPFRSPDDSGSSEADPATPPSVALVYLFSALLTLFQLCVAVALAVNAHDRTQVVMLFPYLPLILAVGLWFGGRAVWASARYYLAFATVSSALFFLGSLAMGHIWPAAYAGVNTLLCALLYWELGRSAARAYFGFICPRCGADRPRGLDILQIEVRCRQCDFRW